MKDHRIDSVDTRRAYLAMKRSKGVITPDHVGNIVSASDDFCVALGCRPTELVGQHHSVLMDPVESSPAEYREFWRRLTMGEFDYRRYLRIERGVSRVTIATSYSPADIRSGRRDPHDAKHVPVNDNAPPDPLLRSLEKPDARPAQSGATRSAECRNNKESKE